MSAEAFGTWLGKALGNEPKPEPEEEAPEPGTPKPDPSQGSHGERRRRDPAEEFADFVWRSL